MSKQIQKGTRSNRDYVFALFNDEGQVRKAANSLKRAGFSVADRNVWEYDDVGERPDKNGIKPDFMVRVKITEKNHVEQVINTLKKLGGNHIEFIKHTMKMQVP